MSGFVLILAQRVSVQTLLAQFQNRRNRTKKTLHKKPVTEGATIPLDTLIHKMGKFAVPSTTESDAPLSNRSTPVGFSSLYVVLTTDLSEGLPFHRGTRCSW